MYHNTTYPWFCLYIKESSEAGDPLPFGGALGVAVRVPRDAVVKIISTSVPLRRGGPIETDESCNYSIILWDFDFGDFRYSGVFKSNHYTSSAIQGLKLEPQPV